MSILVCGIASCWPSWSLIRCCCLTTCSTSALHFELPGRKMSINSGAFMAGHQHRTTWPDLWQNNAKLPPNETIMTLVWFVYYSVTCSTGTSQNSVKPTFEPPLLFCCHNLCALRLPVEPSRWLEAVRICRESFESPRRPTARLCISLGAFAELLQMHD